MTIRVCLSLCNHKSDIFARQGIAFFSHTREKIEIAVLSPRSPSKSRARVKPEQLMILWKDVLFCNTGFAWEASRPKEFFTWSLLSPVECLSMTEYFIVPFPDFSLSVLRWNIILCNLQFTLEGKDCRSLWKFDMLSEECLNSNRNNLINKGSFMIMIIVDSFPASQMWSSFFLYVILLSYF